MLRERGRREEDDGEEQKGRRNDGTVNTGRTRGRGNREHHFMLLKLQIKVNCY